MVHLYTLKTKRKPQTSANQNLSSAKVWILTKKLKNKFGHLKGRIKEKKRALKQNK
jgi:hypothetical protein